MASSSMPAVRFFYGLQPHWLTSDRLYRVYVSNKRLAGAYVAGQFYDERAAFQQLQQLALFFRPFVRKCLVRRQEREALYDSFDPFSPGLLDQDERNFHIDRLEVVRTWVRRRRSLWTPFNAGVVEVEVLDGSIRRFILVGDQRADDVLELISVFDPGVEATGKSNPLPKPKPMAPAALRRRLVVMSLLPLSFAGVFAYAGLWGGVKDPSPLPMAAFDVLLGICCLAMAWRLGRNPPPPEGPA